MPVAELEKKSLILHEAKMSGGSDSPGTLSGYASVKGNIDSYGDVILDGAYKNLESLQRKGWSGFNHSQEPVGMVTVAREDTKGLYIEVEFHSTQYAQDVRKIAQERAAKGMELGMSIMFKTIESQWVQREDQDIRELKAIEVVEAGFVMLPANTAATVTNIKSGSGTPLDAQVKEARELAEDLHARFVDLHEKRSGKLSDSRITDVQEIAQKWADLSELVSKSGDDVPEMATDEVLVSLKPDF